MALVETSFGSASGHYLSGLPEHPDICNLRQIAGCRMAGGKSFGAIFWQTGIVTMRMQPRRMSIPAEVQLVRKVLVEEMEVHEEAPLHQQSQQQTCLQIKPDNFCAHSAYLSHPQTKSTRCPISICSAMDAVFIFA